MRIKAVLALVSLAICAACGGNTAEEEEEEVAPPAQVLPEDAGLQVDMEPSPLVFCPDELPADGEVGTVDLFNGGTKSWTVTDVITPHELAAEEVGSETALPENSELVYDIAVTTPYEGTKSITFVLHDSADPPTEEVRITVPVTGLCAPPVEIQCDGIECATVVPPGGQLPEGICVAGECGAAIYDPDTGDLLNGDNLDGQRSYCAWTLRDEATGAEELWRTGPFGCTRRAYISGAFGFTEITVLNHNVTGFQVFPDHDGGLVTAVSQGTVYEIAFDVPTERFVANPRVTPPNLAGAPGPPTDAFTEGPGMPIYIVCIGPPGTPGQLRRWDPATPLVTVALGNVGDTPVSVEMFGGLLYISNQRGDSVTQYDPDDGSFETFAAGDTPVFLSGEVSDDEDGDGLVDVWATGLNDDTLWNFEFDDEGTLVSDETIQLPADSGPTSVLPVDGEIFITCHDSGKIIVLDAPD